MQGAHRPSLSHSLRNAHADIETPSWRRYVPNFDATNDPEVSDDDDDTTPEAYINTHHELALEERRRWAGTASTNPPPQNGTLRNRTGLSSKRIVPLFPTPKEAFLVVRSALNTFREKNHIKSNRNTNVVPPQRAHLLEALQTTLTSFAEVEEKLRSARIRLKAAVNADAYHTGGSMGYDLPMGKLHRSDHSVFSPLFLNGEAHRHSSNAHSPNHHEQNGRLGTANGRLRSQSPTPPLPKKKPSMLTKESVSMITKHAHSKGELIEAVFRLETSDMREHIKELACQAKIALPESPSFQKMSIAITKALRSNEARENDSSDLMMSNDRVIDTDIEEMIRRAIDATKYPLLARSFTLEKGYCLDGTRRSTASIVQSMRAEKEQDEKERKPWEGLGFLEPEANEDPIWHERTELKKEEHVLEPCEKQGPSEGIDGNGFAPIALGSSEPKKTLTFDNENDLMLTPSVFQVRRLDARRKLRQNVKRKLPRIHKERRNKKAFRFRDSAESISSQSSGASSSSPQWNAFRDVGLESMGIERKPSVTVQFQPVVNLEDKEEGTDESVVYLDDEG